MSKKRSAAQLCKEYIFTIQDILTGPSCRECLRLHLKKQRNEESLLFLESLEELNRFMNREKDPMKILRMMDTLVEKYFCEGNHELNISARDKNNVLKSVESVKKSSSSGEMTFECVNKAFMTIKNIVEQEMSYDVLPRFLRSDEWLNLIDTHGEAFLRQHGTLRKAIEMNFSDDDFRDPCIDDFELEFFYKLLTEDVYHWKLVGSDKKQNIMAFTSKKIIDYFPKVEWVNNGGSCSKYVGILPFSFEFCERYLFNSENIVKLDDNVHGVETLEYLCPSTLEERFPNKMISNNRSCAVLDYHIKLGFPFGSRSSMQVCSGRYDDELQEALMVQKTCSTPLKNSNGSRNTKDMYMISAMTLRKLDDQRTVFSQLHIHNFCSFGANKLVGLLVFKRAKHINKQLIKFLKEREFLPLPDYDLSDGRAKTYFDHKESYETEEMSVIELLGNKTKGKKSRAGSRNSRRFR